jgi:hypothetical protein
VAGLAGFGFPVSSSYSGKASSMAAGWDCLLATAAVGCSSAAACREPSGGNVGAIVRPIKGGVLRVPYTKMLIYLMPTLIDLAGLSSSRRLHR